MPVCADGFWFPSWPGAPSEAGVEASAAVTSDAETAPEQARQQVLQGAIEPKLSTRIAAHSIESTGPRRGDVPDARPGTNLAHVCGTCFYY